MTGLLMLELLLAALVGTGSAIRCYICRSVDADTSTITHEELQQIFAHMPLPYGQTEMTCKDFNEENTRFQTECPHNNHCVKTSGKMHTALGRDINIVYRGCHQESTHDNQQIDTCSWSENKVECVCPYNLCNTASKQGVFLLTLFLFVFCARIIGQ